MTDDKPPGDLVEPAVEPAIPPAADLTRPPAPPRWRVGPFSLRQVTLAIGVVAIAGVLLTLATAPIASIGPDLPVPEPSAYLLGSPVPGLDQGSLAPELTVTRSDGTVFQLTDLQGNAIRLADLRGKVVWLNFWASWCPPCQSETPLLRTMDEDYRARGLAIIGIQVQQTVDDGQRYATTYSLQYTIGEDVSADIFHEYRGFALPTQFFIDPNGVIREVINGPMTELSARNLIEALLPPGPSGAPGSPSSPGVSPSSAPTF
ncbi:MAG TPA: TlpA disulfide reductase family protein [Candidatus Limnocylindrales bacterium]|nr:TlpA disulfide reductase family protein [Candidatus Limnocylindrales bacterium]